MTKHFYHSSTRFLSVLKPNSPVTQYKEDAIYLAAPWLLRLDVSIPSPDKDFPQDDCIYVYKILTNDIVKPDSGRSSCGELHEWCWQTTDWARLELIEYYPSWHKLTGLSLEKKFKNKDRELENFPSI